MAENLYTISVYAENSPGVLHRVSTSFTKRKINIESLTVSETAYSQISLFTITAYVEEGIIDTIVKQLRRIIEVRKAVANFDRDLVYREMALIRVKLKEADSIAKIEELIERYHAEIVHVSDGTAMIESVGTEDDTKIVSKLLEPFEVLQFVRTGRIALLKNYEPLFPEKEIRETK